MDAAVQDELLEREPSDLAANRVEAGHHDRIRRVVDDDVDSSRELEGSNVPPFSADDAPLHLVIRERDRGDSALGSMLGCDALNGECDDLLGLALGVATCRLANLAHPIRRVGLGLFFDSADELGLRVLRGHAGHLLETAAVIGDESVLLLFPLRHGLLAAAEFAGPSAKVAISLLEQI